METLGCCPGTKVSGPAQASQMPAPEKGSLGIGGTSVKETRSNLNKTNGVELCPKHGIEDPPRWKSFEAITEVLQEDLKCEISIKRVRAGFLFFVAVLCALDKTKASVSLGQHLRDNTVRVPPAAASWAKVRAVGPWEGCARC